MFPDILGKVAKFIGHSLKSFKVIQLSSKGELKSKPRLSTVKSGLVVGPFQSKRLQSMSLCPEIKHPEQPVLNYSSVKCDSYPSFVASIVSSYIYLPVDLLVSFVAFYIILNY